MAIDFGQLAQAGKSAVIQARNGLVAKRNATTVQAEREELNDQIALLAGIVSDLNQAALMDAANLVGQAAVELSEIVDSARLKPFDAALQDFFSAFGALNDTRSEILKADALPSAETTAPSPAGPPPIPPPLPPAATGAALPSISTAKDLASLKPEYEAFFAACTVRPERQGDVDFYLNSIKAGRARYENVVGSMAVPWYFVGILHGMEATFNFDRHLHNGDPLTKRTVRVPAGHPENGNPPFTWRDSAVDAVKFKKLDTIADWSIGRMLHLLESFNGFGYRPFKVPTPYLWSFSNLYEKGKYVRDGVYDPNAVSQQCGAAVILKAGKNSGLFA